MDGRRKAALCIGAADFSDPRRTLLHLLSCLRGYARASLKKERRRGFTYRGRGRIAARSWGTTPSTI